MCILIYHFTKTLNYSIETPCYEGKPEIAFSAKAALNVLSARRIIGQPETHHSCLNLPLTLCSEKW